MKVLLTGATGFLGSQLLRVRNESDLVMTLGRSELNDIVSDLAFDVPKLNFRFNRIIHSAGLAHLAANAFINDQDYFKVNTQGTQNLLKAIDNSKTYPDAFIFISSVAVYGIDQGINVVESTKLKGYSAYARSKIEAEKIIEDWSSRNNVKCLILRLPLVVGPGAPGNLGILKREIFKGRYVRIRGNTARRSMVLAEDVGRLLFRIGELEGGIFNLTDGRHPRISEIENKFEKVLGRQIRYTLPMWSMKVIAFWGDQLCRIMDFPYNNIKHTKISSTLTFNDEKARKILNWESRSVIDNFEMILKDG